jgi:hypothetical protein
MSRDGRDQRSLRSATGVPRREQTERRIFERDGRSYRCREAYILPGSACAVMLRRLLADRCCTRSRRLPDSLSWSGPALAAAGRELLEEARQIFWCAREQAAEPGPVVAAKWAYVSLGVEPLVVRLPGCRCGGPGRRLRGPLNNTLQDARFHVPAIGAISLLGAWLVTRIPGRAWLAGLTSAALVTASSGLGAWSFHTMVASIPYLH